MGQTFFEELCSYVQFSERAGAALRRFHPHVEPHFHRITEEFYDRIKEHPGAAAVFTSPAQVRRLKLTLVDWMDTLLRGPWDESYYERRLRIGRMHVRIELPQRYMLTAMSLVRARLCHLAESAFAGDAEERRYVHDALAKILDIELAIMLESYREGSIHEVRQDERRERNLLERRLELSEARYQTVVDGAEVVVLAVDSQGRTALFNRKGEELTGHSQADLRGRECVATLFHPEDAQRMQIALAAARARERPRPLEARLWSATGAFRWIRWHIAPLPASAGALVCAVGLDVTEEHELAERTLRAERLASLGTLAAGLAHEIRNPLNAAQLQLMVVARRAARLEGGESPSALEAVQVVRHELRRLAGLVEDFLSFARPMELRPSSGDLRQTLRTVVKLLEPELRQAGVEVALRCSDPVVAVFDEERIKQVLINLVRNAIEAAGRGGHIELATWRGTQTATLEVIDTGPGVPAALDVFEPFTTTKEGGTGLGLPIVHRIVTDHGGEVTVTRRGNRTVFAIELPLDGPLAAAAQVG